MSEPTAASAPPGGGGKKVLGMSQGQLLIVLGVALVGGAYLLWRSRKKAAAAQQAATSACPDGSQPDASGNCVQSGQDWSGAISTLQTEIADLQGSMAGGGGSGTVGGSTGAGTGGVNPGGTAGGVTPPATGGGTGTGGGFTPAGAISNLQASSTGRTGFTVRWNPASGAKGGYSYVIKQLNGVVVKSGTTTGNSVSVSGLHPGWTYNFGVQALPGGAGNNIHVGPLK